MKCFWVFFHDWGKWINVEKEPYQIRVCKKCNYVKFRYIRLLMKP